MTVCYFHWDVLQASHSKLIFSRLRPSMPHVRVGAILESHEASPPRRSCWTSTIITSTTFQPTASQAAANLFLFTCSPAKSMKLKVVPSKGWKTFCICIFLIMTSCPWAPRPLLECPSSPTSTWRGTSWRSSLDQVSGKITLSLPQ